MASEQAAIADNGAPDPPDEDVEEQQVVERDPGGRYGRFDAVLGRGAFKTVFKAFDEEEGIEVAWNQVKVSELVTSREDRDRLFAEIRVLKQLKHKNIMSFYDSWLDNKTCTVNFITELFTSGTLRQYRKRHKHTDDEVLKRWAWQILCGLVYLHGHQPPIIHRDLKCDNIFVNGSEGVVKIGDLGLATLARARTALTVLGTPEFMAPELYDEDYDDRVDVYSFGMCLLELATMEYPYSECKNAAQIYKKVTLGIRPAGLQKVNSPKLQEFIQLCISPREQRPRARQLLKHPYFDSIRTEKTIRSALGVEGVLGSNSQLDGAPSSIGSGSRTSSAMAELYHELIGLEAANGSTGVATIAEALAAGAAAGGGNGTDGNTANGSPMSSKPRGSSSAGGSPTPAPPSAPLSSAGASPSAAPPAPAPSQPPPSEPSQPPTNTETNNSQQEPAPARPTSPTSDTSSGSSSEAPPAWERSDINRSVSGRQFTVCKLSEHDHSVELRLRIKQPEGQMRTVEFDFDLGSDTAMSIASEMVDDLTLSRDDAQSIASAIKQILEGMAEAADDGTDEGNQRTAVWLAAADRVDPGDQHHPASTPASPVSARVSVKSTPRGDNHGGGGDIALLATSPPAAIAAALERLPDTLFISELLSETLSAPAGSSGLLAHAVDDTRSSESPGSSAAVPSSRGYSPHHGQENGKTLPPSISLGNNNGSARSCASPRSPLNQHMPPSLSLPPHRHTASALVASSAAAANGIAQRLNLEPGPAALLKHSRSAVDLVVPGSGGVSPMMGARHGAFASSENVAAAFRKATLSESEREARRQQASDALRSIEFRCLEGLEGGPLGGVAGRPRGVPMAAAKPPSAGGPVTAATIGPPPVMAAPQPPHNHG